MRLVGIVLLVGLLSYGVAFAQDTETPTPTETPTETPTPTPTDTPTPTNTPTPDVLVWMTLAPPEATQEGTPGTPAPGQPTVFKYETDAGQVLTNTLLFAILVTLWIFGLIVLFRRGG